MIFDVVGAWSVRLLLSICLVFVVLYNANAASCPNSFGAFLERFGSDRAFQESHIRYPLLYSMSEDGECYPDCARIKYRLTAANIAGRGNAVFPLITNRQESGLDIKLSVRGRQAEVKVFMPESDAYSFIFRFDRAKDCWILTSVEDWSL